MSNLNKKIMRCTSLTLAIILLYLQFSKKTILFEELSDYTFLAALFFLIIGTFLWVLSSGFFDLFQKHLKKMIPFQKKELTKEPTPISVTVGHSYRFWLSTGGLLLAFSLITLLIYQLVM